MAARAMVYNRAEADKTVEGVSGIRSDDARLALEREKTLAGMLFFSASAVQALVPICTALKP